MPFTSYRALVQTILVSLAGCATGVDSSNSKDPGTGGAENGDASSSAGGSAGATGQAGTNGIINVAGAAGDSNDISDGSVAIDPDAACAQESRDSQLIAVDLFLMVDRSVSMGCAAAETGATIRGNTTWSFRQRDGPPLAMPSRRLLNSPATAGIRSRRRLLRARRRRYVQRDGVRDTRGTHCGSSRERDEHPRCHQENAPRQHDPERSCSPGRDQLRDELREVDARACRRWTSHPDSGSGGSTIPTGARRPGGSRW